MADIFVSYSKLNQEYALKLVSDLKRRGFDVWIDDERIDYGDDWWNVIVQNVRDCAAIVVIMTPEAADSRWVGREIGLADELGKPAFPLLLNGKNWPFYITAQYADVRGSRMPPADFYDRLAHAVAEAPQTEPVPPTPPLLVSRMAGKSSIEMIHETRHEYWVKGMGLDRTTLGLADVMDKLAQSEIVMRYLIPDPAMEDMCARIDHYLGSEQLLTMRLKNTLRSLGKLRNQFPDQVAVRLLPHRPATGYSVVDPYAETGYLRFRVYHYHMDAVINSLPYMMLHKNEPAHAEWYDRYVQDFETEWNDATDWIATVDELLPGYDERLDARALDRPGIAATVAAGNRKFNADGSARPYHGTTCITYTKQDAALHQTLIDLQTTLQAEFESLGAAHLFSFLKPSSLHMTICDIDASPHPAARAQKAAYVEQMQTAFERIQALGPITAQVRGLGLTRTITALVRFDDRHMLRRVLNMEQHIKAATGINQREFAGHITLAYLVQPSDEKLPEIQARLQSHASNFGPLTFSTIDFVAFSDMNTYLPLVTLDLTRGQITPHQDNLLDWLT